MIQSPHFLPIAVGTPLPIEAYNEIAIIPGITAGSYIEVTNSAGQVLTIGTPTVLGNKSGGMDNWGPVTLEAFVSDGQVAINSEVTFGA